MGRCIMNKYLISTVTLIILISSSLFLSCQSLKNYNDYYLVLYAFDAEGALLADSMQIDNLEQVLGRTVHVGTLCEQKIILAESGVGMTNASMTIQMLIDRFQPVGVFFTGIAGAIDTSVKIGDIVVCDRWITHDYGYLGAEGLKTTGIKVSTISSNTLTRIMEFPVDSSYLNLALKLNDGDISFEKIGDRVPQVKISGVGVTGNTFIDNIEKRQWLSEHFNAMTVDMETAAVAQVCYVNEIPFLAFRSASDLAGGSGSNTADAEIERFFEVAAINSSKVLMRFLREL